LTGTIDVTELNYDQTRTDITGTVTRMPEEVKRLVHLNKVRFESNAYFGYTLDFATSVPPLPGGRALMHNFNSQEGALKPILRIKIAPEGPSILESRYRSYKAEVYNKHEVF
jgi:hypothetical protein